MAFLYFPKINRFWPVRGNYIFGIIFSPTTAYRCRLIRHAEAHGFGKTQWTKPTLSQGQSIQNYITLESSEGFTVSAVRMKLVIISHDKKVGRGYPPVTAGIPQICPCSFFTRVVVSGTWAVGLARYTCLSYWTNNPTAFSKCLNCLGNSAPARIVFFVCGISADWSISP